MSFFGTNFVILLGFLIFSGLCWRYLSKPIALFLDEQIHIIQQELSSSAQARAKAYELHQAAQKKSGKVHKDILVLHRRAQEDLEKLHEEAQTQLKFLIALKDKAHQSKITQLYHEKNHQLKVQIARQTIAIFQEIIQEKGSSAVRSLFTDRMIEQMVTLPKENHHLS